MMTLPRDDEMPEQWRPVAEHIQAVATLVDWMVYEITFVRTPFGDPVGMLRVCWELRRKNTPHRPRNFVFMTAVDECTQSAIERFNVEFASGGLGYEQIARFDVPE